MAHVIVLGAGAMGLAAAHHLLKAGHTVELFEADRVAGGMAAHFDFGGLSIERFYHFVCKADAPTFALLEELGLAQAMRWRPTKMGYFYDGKLYRWGDPLALLAFPKLDPVSKLRYAWQMFMATKRTDWRDLDGISAAEWLRRGSGERAWKVLWEKLFTLKFFELSEQVSAAWLWTRIKRVGTSRRSLMQEELGYIDGGSETLVKALVASIERQGGRLHLGTPVREVTLEGGAVTGIVTAGGERVAAGHVISTVPMPLIPKLIPALPEALKARYAALRNIGAVCVIHKLRRAVTGNFWLNTNDARIEVPGLVEFSNLRPFADGTHIVYVPYYMPQTHPKFARDDDFFVRESFGYLKLVNPQLTDADRLDSAVGRLQYAQPLCPPGFAAMLPDIVTPIRGLQIADTSSYYPEDRGIAESARVAQEMAARVGA
ncbi:MAG TPA: NAD(P)/FAD-dependent oxidoreductase [Plasticicumulans sp.]|uniref:NAD(P)/FAD-dependent oxidoreductase n=1 Tax=Plasticicumulans sp. TaxID=2307179 RepID=UPI002C65E4F9|nr:NAD(P)/FAD-dependent oxidoreductase [Plasticicumulans sp.]HNF65451.1 NAD(P)/FAD-dependent oxidoreductase [Plasticicumulans sp.]HNG49982.1 NAD(P)/FAD-dependent oxidoreductase [Plasticicumulans sp.]HNI22277.1 NAD(P)/FAD-dependent oxidoreductase [Plasticicumulans sp.]HNJ09441.1 NAD(P)/FAD-dependent oxidoreductase [Plasticicumulans sp.]HNK30902.1 NAD(P)/FAD-dependent oxidoreductase [Plasticicumulans sp.]